MERSQRLHRLYAAAAIAIWIEAVLGQFYIAVLVAGLVGALTARQAASDRHS